MVLLDQQLNQTQQQQPVGLVAKKVRRAGEPSSQPPPPGAPVWAVKKDYRKDIQGLLTCYKYSLTLLPLLFKRMTFLPDPLLSKSIVTSVGTLN